MVKACKVNIKKEAKKTSPNPPKIEGYQPGATREQVFEALKRVAKSPSQKHGKQPASTS